MQKLGRPLTAIEIDARRAARLNTRTAPSTRVVDCEPLVDTADRRRYQAMVHQVFTGRGHGIAQILDRIQPRGITRQWLRDNKLHAKALPRELSAAQWADLFALSAC